MPSFCSRTQQHHGNTKNRQSTVLGTKQLLVPVPPEYRISRWHHFHLYPMVHHFLPFQNVTVVVFRAVRYFLYLLTIGLDSEIAKKILEDLEQTRIAVAYLQEKNWQQWQMSVLISSVLFQRAKMIISVLVTWMIVDRNLAVRVLSCSKFKVF